MQHDYNGEDVPVVENQHASETLTAPTLLAGHAPAEGQARAQDEQFVPQNEEAAFAPVSHAESEEQNDAQPPLSQEQEPAAPADEVRPFTAFIEEFRQSEDYPATPQQELAVETFASLMAEVAPAPAPALMTGEPVPEEQPVESTLAEENPPASEAAVTEPVETPVETAPAGERPVSPLLRPATRARMPRHGARHREEANRQEATPKEPPAAEASPAAEAPVETPAQAETAAEVAPAEQTTQAAQVTTETEQVPARPPRRYRFDRPAPSTGARAASPSIAAPSARAGEYRETINRAPVPAHTEHEATPNGHAQAENAAAPTAQQPEAPVTKTSGEATETGNGQATTNGEPERRRKHGQERHREKEQNAAQAAQVGAVAEPEAVPQQPQAQQAQPQQAVAPAEAAPAQVEAVNPEDLPPLEYAELQAATSRRRRRRRTGVGTNGTAAPAAKAAPETQAPTPAPVPAPTPTPAAPIVPPRTGNGTGQYNIVSGYTVNQMNQNSDGVGPFMGPEPSPARGSLPTQHGRSVRAEVQRAPVYSPTREVTGASAASVRHLAETVAQAIQTQTDRMIAELRRANQGPTNVSVTLPPFPSTERVGVFVDVANLLYSARTMRINIDFGKLLDFLRGNRRLVRAHAYCPTSPQPGDEQMFLQAVKGLGYRITTKNYKTFSSGAKKADLDLDLCMDVVRLVDGRAVDCIVLVSGDSDFMPMLDYCSDHGVRVEVAAFDEAMSATLRQSCDLFINLSMLEEIRA
jgi:uncharacterized LabA/DUF88 family protein